MHAAQTTNGERVVRLHCVSFYWFLFFEAKKICVVHIYGWKLRSFRSSHDLDSYTRDKLLSPLRCNRRERMGEVLLCAAARNAELLLFMIDSRSLNGSRAFVILSFFIVQRMRVRFTCVPSAKSLLSTNFRQFVLGRTTHNGEGVMENDHLKNADGRFLFGILISGNCAKN